jgi:DNA repair protein RecO (recombination protein O)
MRLESEAIVCSVANHCEHGAIVRLMTPAHGLVAAYVRGGRGRRMRPVLIAGNAVSARLRSRTDSQLPQAELELLRSRAPILSEALPSAAIDWATALVAAALPERQAYPQIYEVLCGLLDAVESAPAASRWGRALVRFETLVVSELGYGTEEPDPADVFEALGSVGDRLFGNVLAGRHRSLQDARSRLVDRLRRALV